MNGCGFGYDVRNPMPAARLFISHSAKEPETAELLERIYGALTTKGFDVFLDRERLADGTEWRDAIYTAALRSHGALLLLSRSAAEDSDWVVAEAGVLAARRWADRGRFPFLVVTVPPVDASALSMSRFEPFAFGNLQAVRASEPDIVERIVEFFRPLQFATTPFDVLAGLVGDELPRHQETLELAAQRLGLSLPSAMTDDAARAVADALFHSSLENVYAALKTLAGRMSVEARGKVVEVVVPFWVEPRAVVALARTAFAGTAKKTLLLNAARTSTGRMYVHRAAVEYPLSWLVLEVSGSGGDDLEGAIIRDIRDAFRDSDPAVDGDEEDLDAQLIARSAIDPVVIILPAGVPLPVAENVRRQYPTCMFLVLTGAKLPPAAGETVCLEPPLAAGRETVMQALHLACRQLTGVRK